MISEFLQRLSDWKAFDTWIALTGAMAAMACALPGVWLFLRRQSLLGDALSHAVLPGIVVAFLSFNMFSQSPAQANSGLSKTNFDQSEYVAAEDLVRVARRQLMLFFGAALSGVVAAFLSELIQRCGRIDRSAALGVVFTSMFALGLLLIRLFAHNAHIDADCVLYGNLETTVTDVLAGTNIPRGVVVNAAMFLCNSFLVVVFFKELRLATFDAELAASMGLGPTVISLVLMSVTAATVVAAFESVGSILVIAMLIVPAATARLFTDRLSILLVLAPLIAGCGALAGHAAALTFPAIICSRIGLRNIEDASTAGMMAVTTGILFLLAVIASPRHGLARAIFDRLRLQVRIASEDFLGQLYRREESKRTHLDIAGWRTDVRQSIEKIAGKRSPRAGWAKWLGRQNLLHRSLIRVTSAGDELTNSGRRLATGVVRSHRLWESYMARHFDLPHEQLHATAERIEHFLSVDLQAELAAELNQPSIDPQGKSIPSEAD